MGGGDPSSLREGKMKTLLLFIMVLPHSLWALEPVSFEKVQTEYILEKNSYPSCMLFKHRAIERAKVLRELSYASKKNPYHKDIFFVNDFLMNKYFLEMELWQDETVTVRNVWQLTPELLQQIQARQDTSYFWLKGDGVDWIERMSFFPEEVSFEWDIENSQLITKHKTYYVDYCFPREESSLQWDEDGYTDFWSTQESIDNFLNFENVALKLKIISLLCWD